jgi:hypothetical protein
VSRFLSALIGLVATTAVLGGIHPAGANQAAVVVEGREATPADREAGRAQAEQPVYGPILAKDPVVRAEIKRLYTEQNQMREEIQSDIQALYQELAGETDPDLRFEKVQELGTLKQTLERRNIELGLEIAVLNGDERRAADFELALDQILNPESYLPQHEADPELKAERMRELGLDGEVRR